MRAGEPLTPPATDVTPPCELKEMLPLVTVNQSEPSPASILNPGFIPLPPRFTKPALVILRICALVEDATTNMFEDEFPVIANVAFGVVVPIPSVPPKYAFPVVVAPPEMVSPVAPAPPPIVDDAKIPIPTVVLGERREPLYDQLLTPSPAPELSPSVEVATHVAPLPFVWSTMPFVPADAVRS